MIPRDKSSGSHAAFTRTELLFIILATIVIICLATPPIIKVHRQRNLARCNSNLKQVAVASLLWVDENQVKSLPWHAKNPAEGDRRRNECWYHMMSFSNHLTSPQLLVCPADRRARIAKTWDTNPGSGFGAVRYRDQACSYAVALDGGKFVSGTGPIPIEDIVNSIVFLDKHLGGKSTSEQCRSTQIASTSFQRPFNLWWKPELHGPNEGNVSFMDGSVQTGSKSMVESGLPIDSLSKNSTHVLFPKRQ